MDEILHRYFKKISRLKCKEIGENVSAVMNELRPSFLLDAVACDQTNLKNLVLDLNRSFGANLTLLSIDNCHYLIGKIDRMHRALHDALEDKLTFIDVSLGLQKGPQKLKSVLSLPQVVSMIRH